VLELERFYGPILERGHTWRRGAPRCQEHGECKRPFVEVAVRYALARRVPPTAAVNDGRQADSEALIVL